MIIGDMPSREDERNNRPFSGAAGELLSKMLRAINVHPASVYMTNILKCRPGQNSVPALQATGTCRRWLDMELSRVRPAFLLLLGELPARIFTEKEKEIASLVGEIYDKEDYRVMAIYHPAFILGFEKDKQLPYKREAWAALQKFEKLLKLHNTGAKQ
jgi:DNA polymerase